MKTSLYRFKNFLVCWLLILPLFSENGKTAHAQVQAFFETTHLTPAKEHDLGIYFKLAKHWHVYWINPGDSGLPVQITLKMPEGFERKEIKWPAPMRIVLEPLANFGYEDEVLLLIPIKVPKDYREDHVEIKVEADFLICSDLCLPEATSFSIRYPVASSPSSPSPQAKLFNRYRKKLPLEADLLTDWQFSLKKKATSLVFKKKWVGQGPSPDLGEIEFYPLNGGRIPPMAKPVVKETKALYSATLEIENVDDWPDDFAMVIKAENSFIPGQSYHSVMVSQTKEREGSSGLWLFMLYAFLGGLILNLMPCVFPVLSIKAMQLVRHQGDKRHARKQAILFSLGVLVCFWILFLLLYFLTSQGEAVGWGFHLQSPLFLFVMTTLFTAITVNLFGGFEMLLSFPWLKGSGEDYGSFTSGLIAVLVASPCTAPFMGVALGFASTQPPLSQWLIFTSLGGGFALPMAMLTAYPFWQRSLPKPGIWMEHLKQGFGFLMLGSTLWLLWVMEAQVNTQTYLLVLVSLILIAFFLWLYGIVQKGGGKKWMKAVSVFSIVGGLLWGLGQTHQNASTQQAQKEEGWENYSEALIKQYQSDRQAFLIDFTAKWCLTCQVNKQLTFENKEVLDYIEKNKIKLVRADWTSRDAQITKALKKHGRQGVPLVVYYALDRDPLVLPEILTAEIFLQQVKNIGE